MDAQEEDFSSLSIADKLQHKVITILYYKKARLIQTKKLTSCGSSY
jgi:hypothetical protein